MRIRLLPFITAMFLVAGCAPYKMDIRQGNLITHGMRERLKVGMTQTQVRALLGQPLVMDPFHPSRWDYVYSYEHQHVLKVRQHMTLYFSGSTLSRIDDSHMPPMSSGKDTGGIIP